MEGVSDDESHYTVWTVWISVGVRLGLDCILQNLAPLGTPSYVPRAKMTGPKRGPRASMLSSVCICLL